MALLEFELKGSLLKRIATMEEALDALGGLRPWVLPGHLRDLGAFTSFWEGRRRRGPT